jgi:hypothetical protein
MGAYEDHVANLSHSGGLRKQNMITMNTPVPPAKASDDAFEVLTGLIKIVGDVKTSGKMVADLRDATRQAREAADKLAADRSAFDEHQKAVVAAYEKEVAARSADLADARTSHAEAVAAWKAEMQVEMKAIAEEKAQAAKDRAMASDLLARAQKRIRAFNETTA